MQGYKTKGIKMHCKTSWESHCDKTNVRIIFVEDKVFQGTFEHIFPTFFLSRSSEEGEELLEIIRLEDLNLLY